jgi:hypothetical protein
MTREEVKADVESSIDEFLQSIAEQYEESSGIQPPTRVEESLSETEPKPFDLGLEEVPTSQADTIDDNGGPGGGGGPVGACCCCDGTCSETTESECESTGCDFHGADTVCDDEGDPCVATGACCAEDNNCTIESEADCGMEGGTYKGDCTMCTPNPCAPPCCEGAFLNPDNGLYYLTRTRTSSYSSACTGTFCNGSTSWTETEITTIDPDTCESSCDCSGTSTFTLNCVGGPHNGDFIDCSGTVTGCGFSGTGDWNCIWDTNFTQVINGVPSSGHLTAPCGCGAGLCGCDPFVPVHVTTYSNQCIT